MTPAPTRAGVLGMARTTGVPAVFTEQTASAELAETLAAFPVYRTYVDDQGWAGEDREVVERAIWPDELESFEPKLVFPGEGAVGIENTFLVGSGAACADHAPLPQGHPLGCQALQPSPP